MKERFSDLIADQAASVALAVGLVSLMALGLALFAAGYAREGLSILGRRR